MHLPNAWDGSPLVYMSPALLTITPEQYDVPYTVSMTPRVCMAMGDYYARMEFR